MATVPNGTMRECLKYGISLLASLYIQTLFFILSLSLDMEGAIKTIVTTFIGSSRGKENLNSKSFQKLVSNQLGGIMEVKNYTLFLLFCSLSPFV